MADLATLGRAHAAGLTGAVGREVVVVHVALARLGAQRVELLLHAEHVERGDTQDLGLAALEQCRAVGAGHDVDLGRERADVGETATVDAHLVAQDALTDQLLGDRAQCGADLLLAALELTGETLGRQTLDAVELLLALVLAGDGERGGELGRDRSFDGVVRVGLVVGEQREVARLLGGLGSELALRVTEDADELLRGLGALCHDLLGRRSGAALDELDRVGRGLGLDHHDRDVIADDATRDDHVEHGLLELRVRRECHPLALDQGDAGGTDRAAEGQAGDLRGHRRGVDRDDVV